MPFTPTEQHRCHTGLLVESLPPPARIMLTQALNAPTVLTGDILAVLADHGVEARAENINRHRRRLQGGNYTCKCPVTDEKATL